MNKVTLFIVAFFCVKAAFAHTIVGTPMLKGSIKTEVVVAGKKAKCRFSVEEVGNHMREDSWGNPVYFVEYELNLSDGFDGKIDFTKKGKLINYFKIADGKTETRDYDYSATDGQVRVKMDTEGYISSAQFTYKNQKVLCKF